MSSTGRKVRAAIQAFIVTILRLPVMTMLFLISNVLLLFPDNWIQKRYPILRDAASLNIGYKTFFHILHEKYRHFVCPLKVGLQAPNINILTLDGVSMKILDFQRSGRPLVVNFGSCT